MYEWSFNLIILILKLIILSSIVSLLLNVFTLGTPIKNILKKNLFDRKPLKDQSSNLFEKYYARSKNTHYLEELIEDMSTLLLLSGVGLTIERFIFVSVLLGVSITILSLVFIKITIISLFFGGLSLFLPLIYIKNKRGKNKEKINEQVHEFMKNCREVSPRCNTPREIVKLACDDLSDPLKFYLTEAVSMMEFPIENSLVDIAKKIGDRDLQTFASFMKRKKETSGDYYIDIDNFMSIISNQTDVAASNNRVVKAALSTYRLFIVFFISDFVVYSIIDPNMLGVWHTEFGRITLLISVILLSIQGILVLSENFR